MHDERIQWISFQVGRLYSCLLYTSGVVDLAPFQCDSINRSSLVTRVCYDRKEQYMVIGLQGTYYHYCEIDAGTVSALRGAESMGRFYNSNIKGRFDCRTNRVPTYT